MLHGPPALPASCPRFVEEIRPRCANGSYSPRSNTKNRGQQAISGWSEGGGRAPAADPNRYKNAQRSNFEKQRPDEQPFAVGQNVRHDKFGDGVVIDFEGRGLDARVQVRFASQVTKWLALQYAKLTAV